MSQALPHYTLIEDRLNASSHAIGCALSVVGSIALVSKALFLASGWHIVSAAIYGLSLIALFGSSAAYHAIQNPRLRALMQRFDHISILYLIAGTFTPFALVSVQTPWGWTVFGFVWLAAIFGTVVHLTALRRFHLMMVVLNLVMGWSALLLIGPLMSVIETTGFIMLVAGGLVYTLGLVFYLNPRIPLNHFIWHLFVLMAATLHYLTVLFYVF